jgi:hypothetical protein
VSIARVIAGLLALEAGPLSEEAAHIASDLVEAADLPPGGPDRREIEELVWARLGEGAPSATLRALATRLGFSNEGLAALAAEDPPPSAPMQNS